MTVVVRNATRILFKRGFSQDMLGEFGVKDKVECRLQLHLISFPFFLSMLAVKM